MQFKVENKVLISSILLHSNLFFMQKVRPGTVMEKEEIRTKIKPREREKQTPQD